MYERFLDDRKQCLSRVSGLTIVCSCLIHNVSQRGGGPSIAMYVESASLNAKLLHK
jgi:hypothetical protein